MTHRATNTHAVPDGGTTVASSPPRLRGAWIVNDWRPVEDPLWQRILTEHAGVNLYGDPHLRIVNGSSRLELIGGLWSNVEREDAGLPTLRYQWDQKYPWLEDYWLVEEWAPTTISRETWLARELREEDGVTYLSHPLYPERGEYRYLTHFRRKLAGGGETPDVPTTTGLRFLAGLWRRSKELRPPTARENARRAQEARARQEADARRKNRDIFYNEVGGITGLTPTVSLAGLDVPKD